MENPIKMDDLGVPLFLETPKCWKSPSIRAGMVHEASPCRNLSSTLTPELRNGKHHGNLRALLRETNGFHNPLIRPAISWGKRGIGGSPLRFP